MKLEEVHEAYKEYYSFESKKRIDLLLALILSRRLKGKRVWLLFEGPSGAGKTALTDPLEYVRVKGEEVTVKSSQITESTLVSGKRGVEGLAKKLDGKVWYFPDFSTVLKQGEKIYPQLRDLYDGFVRKQTGNLKLSEQGKKKAEVTLVSNIPGALHEKVLLNSILGTRFLIYRLKTGDLEKVMGKALEKRVGEEANREIGRAISWFLKDREVSERELPEEDKEFLKEEAKEIAELRAEMIRREGEEVGKEVPTRLVKQLRQLWLSLLSLKENYKKERAKEILRRVKNSYLTPRLHKILWVLKEGSKEKITEELDLDSKEAEGALEILTEIGLKERENGKKSYGGEASEGEEVIIERAGFKREVLFQLQRKRRQTLFIKAPSGYGKTTFLKNLAGELDGVYLKSRPRKYFLEKIARRQGVSLKGKRGRKRIIKLLKDVIKNPKRPVLLLDEAENLTKGGTRILKKLKRGGFKIIAAGTEEPELEFGRYYKMLPLKDEKAEELIFRLLSEDFEKVPADLVKMLKRKSGKVPEKIKKYCKRIKVEKGRGRDFKNDLKKHKFFSNLKGIYKGRVNLFPASIFMGVASLLLAMRYFFYGQQEYQTGYLFAMIAYFIYSLHRLRR